jgi:hypothetical protein
MRTSAYCRSFIKDGTSRSSRLVAPKDNMKSKIYSAINLSYSDGDMVTTMPLRPARSTLFGIASALKGSDLTIAIRFRNLTGLIPGT